MLSSKTTRCNNVCDAIARQFQKWMDWFHQKRFKLSMFVSARITALEVVL